MMPVGLIHIGKTGGTSVAQSPLIHNFGHVMFYDDDRPDSATNYIYVGHDPERASGCVAPLSEARRFYCVSIVRNHYDWLVSYADWCGCFVPWNPGHYDHEIAKKGFDYLINSIVARDTQWPSRKFLFCQLFTPTGRCVPDHLFHTECLDKELAGYFGSVGATWVPQSRQKVGKRNRDHGRYDTTEWYFRDKTLAERVWDCWKEEMQLYGYGADVFQRKPRNGFLSGAIANRRDRVRYLFKNNQLEINTTV
jgi:hypothetical protein